MTPSDQMRYLRNSKSHSHSVDAPSNHALSSATTALKVRVNKVLASSEL